MKLNILNSTLTWYYLTELALAEQDSKNAGVFFIYPSQKGGA